MGNLKDKLTQEEWDAIEKKTQTYSKCNLNKKFSKCDRHSLEIAGCYFCEFYLKNK